MLDEGHVSLVEEAVEGAAITRVLVLTCAVLARQVRAARVTQLLVIVS